MIIILVKPSSPSSIFLAALLSIAFQKFALLFFTKLYLWKLIFLLIISFQFILQRHIKYKIAVKILAQFGQNTEIYRVNLDIQGECGKMQTKKTPNTETFF